MRLSRNVFKFFRSRLSSYSPVGFLNFMDNGHYSPPKFIDNRSVDNYTLIRNFEKSRGFFEQKIYSKTDLL